MQIINCANRELHKKTATPFGIAAMKETIE